MRRNFTITRKKRTVLFYSAVIFLLQTIAPAFNGALAKTVDGYTDTLCTMYGTVTVFVALDDGSQQERKDCNECAVCLLSSSLNGAAVAQVFLLDPLYLADADAQQGPLYRVIAPPHYSSFLSRAPPA